MASLKLQLLGQFRAQNGAGGSLSIASKKGQALLAYLALTAGQRHSRDKLAMLLWSDRPDDRARHSLRQCVLTLRKVLGSDAESALLADDEGLWLDAEQVEVDALAFEQAVAAGSREALEGAMALYGGDLLEDLNARSEEFEVWLRAERPRFRNLAVAALAALAAQQAGAGEAEASIATCQRLLQLDPLHEPAHRLLMRLLTEQGRRAAALRQYQVCEETLRDELGAEPEAETRRLFDQIRSQSYEAAEESEPPQTPEIPEIPETPVAAQTTAVSPGVSTAKSRDLSEGIVAAKRLWLTLLLTWRRSLDLLRAILSGARQGLVWVLVGAACALAVMGGVIWLVFLSGDDGPRFAPVRPTEMAFPLPKKPSIAVLPFETLGDHPEQADLSDGITGGITDALSIMSEMFVIAPGTAIQIETPVNLPKTAKELGVRYLLFGSIQWSSDQVRVSARLIDAVQAQQIWAARYDREIKEVFQLQDEITQEIVTALQVQMTEGEQERIAFQHGTQNLEAWMLAGNGLKLLRRLTREDNVRARGLYRRATGVDPNYAGAWAGLAWTYFVDARFGWSASPEESLDRAAEYAQKAIALDPARPRTYAILGELSLIEGDHEKAIELLERGVELSPNGADVVALLGDGLTYTSEYQRAIGLIERAMRLSPYYPAWYRWSLGRAYRLAGRHVEALAWLEATSGGEAPSLIQRVELVATYSEMRRMIKARAEAAAVVRDYPRFSVRKWTRWPPHKNPSEAEREVRALVKAGLPE
jgi:DNA-binding SARP family transcriptional activator/TolB-like protein/Tfp pilus assembly protein PilF